MMVMEIIFYTNIENVYNFDRMYKVKYQKAFISFSDN